MDCSRGERGPLGREAEGGGHKLWIHWRSEGLGHKPLGIADSFERDRGRLLTRG